MSCYSKHILDLFYNVQNTGRIIKPDAIGKAGSKAEGTVIEFSWRVEDGIIKDARFRTLGDVNAIAISSVLTTMMIGKSIDDVLSIAPEDILEHLRDTKPNYLYLTDLALAALGKTYENYEKKNNKANRIVKQSEISVKLQEDLQKIESGEFDEDFGNLDLSNVSNFSDEAEENYLRNVSNYEQTLEENSLEKSLEMLYSFAETKVENTTTSRGRGRPRKERTQEEIEAELNKVKRGRGRPRKERTPEEIEAELNKIKRGRGRPRKEVPISEPQFNEDDDFGIDVFAGFKVNSPEPSYSETIFEKRGRGRPRKERTAEEIEAELNKEKRGRGRPRKERTPEEIEAELNKVKRGRGRPRKAVDETVSDFEENKIIRGRGRPRKERTPEEIEAELNKVKRGRGRPRKEPSLENVENIVKRPVGRPKKESAFVIQSISPVNLDEKVEEIEPTNAVEEVEVEIENSMVNNFAPANNKFTIGNQSKPFYTSTTTTTYKKVETETNYYTNIKESYNVVSEKNVPASDQKEIDVSSIKIDEPKNDDLELSEDIDISNAQPLSDDVNNILQKGGSIEEALKFLLDN